MKVRLLAVSFALFCGLGAGAQVTSDAQKDVYQQAVTLYQEGVYGSALQLFDQLEQDAMTSGYKVLCALKMRSSDYQSLMDSYNRTYPSTALTSSIRFENARLLFDQGRWAEATIEFSKVNSSSLDENDVPEYFFKCAFCEFSLGRYPQAEQFFTILEALEHSDYTAPGRYLSGIMRYNNSDFAAAEGYFWKVVEDPRFSDLASFYIVDCEFNQKNYQYAISEGEKIFASAPKERQERLARIISESYLILGDNEKARQYYDDISQSDLNRKDLFYAGSLLYSVHDYQGAIDNYTKMTDRSDSLGQIANYHLANAYLRTRNQVAAMEAFLDASNVDFDPEITEDACFNHAKLAFDLNKDTSGFARYIKRYSTSTRGDQIYGYMALAALADKDYTAAVEAYDKIDELTDDMLNNYTKANFLRAHQLFEGSSYRDAVPYFRATSYYLPKTDRLNQFSRYWLGESYYRTGNFASAEQTFTELYNQSALHDKLEGEILSYNIGYSHFKQSEYEAAARWFDIYIASGHSLYRQDAMNRRADCDFARQDYKAAIQSYQKVISEFFSPDNIYPYYQQAISYGLSGDKKRKVSTLLHIEDASEDAPLYLDAYYELGRAQMDAKNNNDAIRSFTHLKEVSKDPGYVAKALIGLGLVHRNMSKYDQALDYYKEVVASMPDSEYAQEAMMAIESIYQTRKQPEKFLEYVEANRLNADKTEAEKEKMYFNAAEQLYLASSFEQAVPTIKKFIETFPQSADLAQAKFYLAESYRALGQKEQACDFYAEAMKAESQMSFVEMSKLRFAELSYQLERYTDAYNAYTDLLASTRMDANRSVARVGMMRAAYRSRSYEQAVSACDAVLGDQQTSADLSREASFVKAKSLLATSKRSEAMAIFAKLGENPSTPEGAESRFMTIQDLYDRGVFESVDEHVYSFSQTAGQQSYWLARAFIVLGDSFEQRGQYEQAKATFESVRDGYEPSGSDDDVIENVNKRLSRLESLMQQ